MSRLLLWLEGPLQSWGADSRYCARTTLPFPTRSGVLGLLCSATGRRGEQRDWLAHMASLGQTVRSYPRVHNGRIHKAPILVDFHMVGSGYDKGDPWQNLHILKKSDGKAPRNAPGTKITYRHYLQDMAFACALEVPEDEALQLLRALQQPVWELSLGRKNCPPSARVARGVFATEEDALSAADAIAREKNRQPLLTVRDGAHEDGDETWTLRDVPLCFGIFKEYRERQVTLYYQ